jgi:hypothetical protein
MSSDIFTWSLVGELEVGKDLFPLLLSLLIAAMDTCFVDLVLILFYRHFEPFNQVLCYSACSMGLMSTFDSAGFLDLFRAKSKAALVTDSISARKS